jgi:hypothetical protein
VETLIKQQPQQTTGWVPASPFLQEPSAAAVDIGPASAAPSASRQTPFVDEYVGDEARAHPQSRAFASLLGELRDGEFEDALVDLVNETAAVLEERFSAEAPDSFTRAEMEEAASRYLEPLQQSAERMVDRIAAELDRRGGASLSEEEVDAIADGARAGEAAATPAFEEFLKGIVNKVKKAVKKVSSLMPTNVILGRIKKLVKPLLRRVLATAMDKLPAAVRPIAKQLAARFLGGAGPASQAATAAAAAADAEPEPDDGDAASVPAGELEHEFDVQLAGYLAEGEQFEAALSVQRALQPAMAANADRLRRLEAARARFARTIVGLEEGEDPRPAVEEFLPAILPALKMGISIIGRPRVVKFLAGLVANLISKYVGKQPATQLSTALVDTGLRMMTLEAPLGAGTSLAGDALAATVEDTINRLVQAAPESAWESTDLLEGFAYEAFERAAAAHFPDPLIREDLREAVTQPGAWMALPLASEAKRYKKYSRVIDAVITPQAADAIATFGGTTLGGFLRDGLRISGRRPVKARVHLFEAVPGSTLSLISLHEKNVRGLGSASREAWSQLHPLTPQAAGFLIGEPGLGTQVAARFLADRNMIAVGQRFYFLEIDGGSVQVVPPRPGQPPRPAHSSETRVIIDTLKKELRVYLYYSEADSQSLAKSMRAGLHISSLMTALRARLSIDWARTLRGDRNTGVQIIREGGVLAALGAQAAGAVVEAVAKAIVDWLLAVLKRELDARHEAFVADFTRAAAAPADGVTVAVVIQASGLVELLGKATGPLASTPIGPLRTALTLLRQMGTEYRLAVRPGYDLR